MIIHHQNNTAAFAGGHTIYWLPRQIIEGRVSATTAAPSVTIIAQARANQRFIFTRTFGRVN